MEEKTLHNFDVFGARKTDDGKETSRSCRIKMVEGHKEPDYLRMLAHWFDQMELQGRFTGLNFSGQEVARHLERIAEKLQLIEAHINIRS